MQKVSLEKIKDSNILKSGLALLIILVLVVLPATLLYGYLNNPAEQIDPVQFDLLQDEVVSLQQRIKSDGEKWVESERKCDQETSELESSLATCKERLPVELEIDTRDPKDMGLDFKRIVFLDVLNRFPGCSNVNKWAATPSLSGEAIRVDAINISEQANDSQKGRVRDAINSIKPENNPTHDSVTEAVMQIRQYCGGAGFSLISTLDLDKLNYDNVFAYWSVGGLQYAPIEIGDVPLTVNIVASKGKNLVRIDRSLPAVDLVTSSEVESCKSAAGYYEIDCLADFLNQTEYNQYGLKLAQGALAYYDLVE